MKLCIEADKMAYVLLQCWKIIVVLGTHHQPPPPLFPYGDGCAKEGGRKEGVTLGTHTLAAK